MSKNESENKTAKSFWHTVEDFILPILLLLMVISAFTVAIVGATKEVFIPQKEKLDTAIYHSQIEESVRSGIIIDKKSYTKIDRTSGFLGFGGSKTSRLVYEFVVSYEITYEDGEEFIGEKTFEVSEGAFLSYEIGDFFDSLNYKNNYLTKDE